MYPTQWLFTCFYTLPTQALILFKSSYVYSRLSLFRLSEVRPPRYTGHLAWHGMLAMCLLHKTHPEVRIPASAGCPKQGFQCNFIRVLRPDMTFGVWFSK